MSPLASRYRRWIPIVVILLALAPIVAHAPIVQTDTDDESISQYRTLYDHYVGPSLDKVYAAGQAGFSGLSTGRSQWVATCDRCLVNPELCGKFGRRVFNPPIPATADDYIEFGSDEPRMWAMI
jgi:hypothetical protein